MTRAPWLGVATLVVAAATAAAQTPQAGEDVARRQLESGRSFARQGNYAEAIRDFQAVAETHATTSVADDAWLELARYHFNVARDEAQTKKAVDAILTNYATSDSAPAAYVLAGRLAMAHSRQAADLETALANFDRVSRLFPNSEAVPRALQMAGQALFYAGRLDEALASLGRVTAEFSTDPAAADAYLTAGDVLVAMGDPIVAMEELQQVRNRWPESAWAATALDRITLLHRLYVRAPHGPAYRAVAEGAGPARLENVVGLTLTGDQRVIWATETGIGVAAPADAERPTASGRPRALALDAQGRLTLVENTLLRLPSGETLQFAVPESGGFRPLAHLVAAAQLSGGDWLVMDDDQRAIQRFSPDTRHVATYQAARVTTLVVSATDRVVGLDKDGRNVFVFDQGGQMRAQVQLRTETYDLRDASDVKLDAFGHIYVLDRDALAVFTPYGPGATPSAPVYALVTRFSVPEGQPGRFDRATDMAVDGSGTVYLYDDRAKKIQVYR
jgi:outer membrane protein assembly factor BamD (BamD/ComL family)